MLVLREPMVGGLNPGVIDHGTRISDEAAHGTGHVIIDGEDLFDAGRLDQRRGDTFLNGQHNS